MAEIKVKISKTIPMDRLSDLPDPIIHHIFSFLDMRLVMQTSVLANRWRNLSASTPCLNFNFTCSSKTPLTFSSIDKEKRRAFIQFVDRVLICRDASNIHKFSLSSLPALDVDHLHTWLIGVLKRNVKELFLLSGADQPFELPPRLFTSGITVLTLAFSQGTGEMQLPNTISSAAKLRILELENVKLPDGNSDGELILSCPILESLRMVWCDDSHLKVVSISAVALKTLKFITEPNYDSSCVMNVCCPNLTSIMYTCNGNPNLSSMNLPALVCAYINIFQVDTVKKEGYDNWLATILRGICNARSLTLGAYTLRDITNSRSILQMLPNLFTNLKVIALEECVDDFGRTSLHAMGNIFLNAMISEQ